MTSIKKNFSYNVLYQVLNLVLPLVTAPYISRVLGVDGIGINSYTYSVVSYFMMACTLGLNNYGNREISSCRDNPEQRSKTFCSIYAMQLFISIISLSVYLICIFSCFDKTYRIIWLISSIYIISSALDINWFFFGIEQFKITVTRNCVIRIITFLLMFVIVKNPNDVSKYIFLLASSAFLTQAVLWVFVKRYISFVAPSFNDISKHFVPNLILFLPVLAISLYEIMDKIMLGALRGIYDTGIYESANKVIRVPQAIFSAFGTVMLPRISWLVANNDVARAKCYIRDSMQCVVFLASALLFGAVGVAHRFIPIFYGKGFDDAVTVFIIMAPVLLIAPWKMILRTQCLIPMRQDKSYIISVFLGAFINLVLNILFIPRLGAYGAAAATLAAESVICFYQTFACRKLLNIKVLLVDNYHFIISGLIMFLIIRYFDSIFNSDVWGLILEIMFGALMYLVISTLLFVAIDKSRFKYLISFILNLKRK